MSKTFDKFSEIAKKVIVRADQIGKDLFSSTSTEHLLLALIQTEGTLAYEVLRQYDVTEEQVKLVLSFKKNQKSKSGSTVEFKNTLKRALKIAMELKHLNVDSEHLLLAILSDKSALGYILIAKLGIEPRSLKTQIERLFEELAYLDEIIIDSALDSQQSKLDKTKKRLRTPALDFFCKDLVKQVKAGKIDPIFERENEIEQIMQVLLRKNKNNPLLIGPSGVGKTAIVEGFAGMIAKKQAPSSFQNCKIFGLDLGSLVAGTTYRGQFEERVKKVIDELQSVDNAILFIDEMHTMVGMGSAEGSLDFANILKPILTKKSFRVIGATTEEEFRKFVEKDPALERRFQKININEPSKEQTKKILLQLTPYFARFHNIVIGPEVIDFTIETTDLYLKNRYFPDKAIDAIDQASSSIRLEYDKKRPAQENLIDTLDQMIEAKNEAVLREEYQKALKFLAKENEIKQKISEQNKSVQNRKIKPIGQINIEAIAEVISRWSSIPREHILAQSTTSIKNLDRLLNRHIIGQKEAISKISKAIWRGRAGISSPERPQGSFLFLGPTGVGKTETVKNLAQELFGSKDSIIKLDMSEFMERHSSARILGAPPGYVGYDDSNKLINQISKNPYSVVLFDEIEKAHPDITHLLLQILEDGYYTDSKGKKINFRHAIIILTSNLGMHEFNEAIKIGFEKNQEEIPNYDELKNAAIKKVKEHFAPEFINRLDDIIVFNPLNQKEVRQIVYLEIEKLLQRLNHKKITLYFEDNIIEFLAKKGFDPKFGARPIKRAIIDYLENPLAKAILDNPNQKQFRILQKGEHLIVQK